MCTNNTSSCSRKGKKQRIPRRGPGVAELEKILREQEKRDDEIVSPDFSFPPLIMHRNHPSMMNLLIRSEICSSSSTPSQSSSAGVYHIVEPPSNQKHCRSCISPEQDKMIVPKRSKPNFLVDNRQPAPPLVAGQFAFLHRLDPSSSSTKHGGTTFRNPEPSSVLMIKLDSPTTTLPSNQPDLSKFKQLSFHEEIKENSDGLVPNKGFFNFLLQPEEKRVAEDTSNGLQKEKCSEKTKCSIDLDLKL